MNQQSDNKKEKKEDNALINEINVKEKKVVEMPTAKIVKESDIFAFTKVDLEMQNLFIEQENIKLKRELSVVKRKVAELHCQIEAFQLDKMQASVEDRIKIVNPRYQSIVKKIAEQHGIKDPKKMSIDTDSFIVREIGVDIPG